MKTFLAVTSAAALMATMSIALAQTQKGEQGQKEMSQPSMKEGPSGEKDTPKAGEKKEAPADQAPSRKQKGAQRRGHVERHCQGCQEGYPPTKKGRAKTRPRMEKRKLRTRTGAARTLPRRPLARPTSKGKGDASLTQEQRTKVQGAFAKHRGKSARNISVNVGVAVPRTVELYAVPEDIVVIVPAYRRYRYFVVGDRVCIVDPATSRLWKSSHCVAVTRNVGLAGGRHFQQIPAKRRVRRLPARALSILGSPT